MRRTVEIDDSLLKDAQRLLSATGISDTIDLALREVLQRSRLERLRQSLGKMKFGISPEELIGLRNTE